MKKRIHIIFFYEFIINMIIYTIIYAIIIKRRMNLKYRMKKGVLMKKIALGNNQIASICS